MKNLFVIFLMAVALMSCEGPMGPEGPQGPEGESGKWILKEPIIEETQWVLAKDLYGNPYYYYELSVKELTEFIYLEGTVHVEIILDYKTEHEAQAPLPYENDYKNELGKVRTERYTYEYMPGLLTFLVKYSDNFNDVRPPTGHFKVLLHY